MWKVYYPSRGEKPSDAYVIDAGFYSISAREAAEIACVTDYYGTDDSSCTDEPFEFTLIAPNGDETQWYGCHEVRVEPTVRPKVR